MIWTIGIVIFLFILDSLFILGLSKQKERDILKIYIDKDENRLYLLLTDDNYMNFDINETKEENLKDFIKYIIKSRAFELKRLVVRISLINLDDKEFEEELLNILKTPSTHSTA